MCYSKEYNSSDGIPEFFKTGTTTQLAACKTGYYMSGGKTKTRRYKKTKRTNKTKRKYKRKSKKYITLY
jgi:hypothetical protein